MIVTRCPYPKQACPHQILLFIPQANNDLVPELICKYEYVQIQCPHYLFSTTPKPGLFVIVLPDELFSDVIDLRGP